MHFLGAYEAQYAIFQFITPEKSTRKAGLEVCGWLLHPILNPEKKPTFKSLPVCKSLEALFSLYFLYTGCFYDFKHSLTWFKMKRQTNMHTNTHFLENNFRKPGVCPQPTYSWLWARAWLTNWGMHFDD